MALTEEQIKNLKPGDTVLVEAEVSSTLEYGVVVTHGCITHSLPAIKLYPLPEQPKHDPCRLFKKGDVVEPRMLFGRCYIDSVEHLTGKRCIVKRDEEKNRHIIIIHKDIEYIIDPAYLKLVTPVEELEPYSVVDAHTHWDVADKDMKTVVTYSKATHPYAKAAAEAERDHLNEEYRKNH